MRRIVLVLLSCIGLAALSGCSIPRGAAVASEVLSAQDDATASYAVVPVAETNIESVRKWANTGGPTPRSWPHAHRGPASPVIRTGDTIDLTIWDSQENSLLTAEQQKVVEMPKLVVSPAGTIFVPYLDEVVVRGMTPMDARQQIQNALEPIVPSAQVQLSHQAGRQNAVDMVSGVAKPGSYPLMDRNSTILSLIAQAGGVSDDLRNPMVRLIRGGTLFWCVRTIAISQRLVRLGTNSWSTLIRTASPFWKGFR